MKPEKETGQVQLYNGEPVIRVTKTEKGNYEWSTIASGMMSHSLMGEVEKYMKKYSYEFYVVDHKERYNYESQCSI